VTVSVGPSPSQAARPAPPAPSPVPQPQAAPPAKPVSGLTIDAPLNGTFYRTEGPGKPNLVKEGDDVAVDAPVCIVEAMKMFNPIKAPFKCKIVRFLVEHGKPVQKGQPLIQVEKK
jgi:acetyl-CoA carboxylase biotin carboxyl carrier protein